VLVSLIFKTRFIKHENLQIGSKIISGRQTDKQTDRRADDFINLLSFLESRLKNVRQWKTVEALQNVSGRHEMKFVAYNFQVTPIARDSYQI
jgi:hypothetical protein